MSKAGRRGRAGTRSGGSRTRQGGRHVPPSRASRARPPAGQRPPFRVSAAGQPFRPPRGRRRLRPGPQQPLRTRSLERPYLKDVAAPLRSCVVTSPASQRAEPCVSKAPPPPRVLHVGQCLLRSSRPVGEVVKLEGMIIARTGVKHTTGKTQTRLLP